MKRRLRAYSTIVCLLILVGCAGSGDLLRPGDKVGAVLLSRTTSESLPYSSYCQRSADTPSPLAPGSYTSSCTVPATASLWIDDGWISLTQQDLDASWSAMSWQLYVDGQQVDLKAFGTVEDPGEGDQALKSRSWDLALANPTGQHTIRVIFQLHNDIFDGQTTYSAGTYESTNTVTIQPN